MAAGKEVRATSPFQALEPDELSFFEGDVLSILGDTGSPGWIMARRGNQVGLIPENGYFESSRPGSALPPAATALPVVNEQLPLVMPPRPPPPQQQAGASSDAQGFEAFALGRYDAKGHGDLSLAPNERVSVLPQAAPQSGWWLARVGEGGGAKVGLVPSTYIQRVGAPPSRPATPPTGAGVGGAEGGRSPVGLILADFSAEDASELACAAGELLSPTGASAPDGWIHVARGGGGGGGGAGIVPLEYVRMLSAAEAAEAAGGGGGGGRAPAPAAAAAASRGGGGGGGRAEGASPPPRSDKGGGGGSASASSAAEAAARGLLEGHGVVDVAAAAAALEAGSDADLSIALPLSLPELIAAAYDVETGGASFEAVAVSDFAGEEEFELDLSQVVTPLPTSLSAASLPSAPHTS